MKALLALALLLAPALTAASAPEALTWWIDPARSLVQFSVRKFWFAHERGTFMDVRGEVRRIDTRIGHDLAEVVATLDVDSLRMDDPDSRRHALDSRFFDAARFPVISFSSDPFPVAELTTGGTLHGLLTLHGERHPVTFALLPTDCPRQPLACVIRVRGNISRSRFGMRAWRGVLSDKVALDLRIVLRMRPDDGPPQPDDAAS